MGVSEKLLQNPFIFHPCDSIINHKIDKISNNWMGYSVSKNNHHYRTLLLKNNVLEKIYEIY